MTLESRFAGTWYPGTQRAIRGMVAAWEADASRDKVESSTRPNILVLPHAGWAYSGSIAWQAVRRIRGAKYSRVVVLAPSHRAWIENRLVAPEGDAFATPLGEIKVDRDWLDRLALLAPVARSDKIHLAEPAAQIAYPLVMGSFDADQMAMCARALARLMDGKTLLVISSDFTHYGTDFSYAPYGTEGGEDVRRRVAQVDAEAVSFIVKRDAEAFAASVSQTGATICGRIPIELALRALPEKASIAQIAYATSGDRDHDFTRFVCYMAAAGRAEWAGEANAVLDAASRQFLLRLARESMECAVTGRKLPRERLAEAPAATRAKMGAFVTLNDAATGALRGCIGEILPMRPLVDAVAARAVDSALHDPRFSPVTERELKGLRVEVSALTPPKPVASWRDIVLGRDGMTLEKNGAFAVFLPQVAPEQGWDLPTTLSYLSRKAGLPADAWREGTMFTTFQAEVFHE